MAVMGMNCVEYAIFDDRIWTSVFVPWAARAYDTDKVM